MKTGFIVLIISLCPMFLMAQATATALPSGLSNALGKGDVTTISGLFTDKLDLTITGKEETVSKSEAQSRLREFYAAHAAKGYKMMHSGDSKTQDSTYTIGELTTDNGSYRVYIYFVQQAGSRLINELRIEQ